jgi:AcrR family transcriptional regulator
MATVPARERILDAAQRAISEFGAARLTLDVVAHAAGVSKGGLLYHFPTKEALIGALADDYVLSMSRCVQQAMPQHGADDGVCRELQAHIVGLLQGESRLRIKTLGAALIVAAANDINSLKVIRDKLVEQNDRLAQSGANYASAAVILLAIDGLLFREAMQMSPFTEAQREQTVAELLVRARNLPGRVETKAVPC